MTLSTVLPVWKPQGLTSLETITRLRECEPQFHDEKLGYAGILDPLAEGVLLVLVGDENKKRDEYKSLDKAYVVDMLFGVSTDTFDIMGRIQEFKSETSVEKSELEKTLSTFPGKLMQKYPPYASVRVQGKALFEWARANKLSEIQIPEKEREIYSITLTSFDPLTSQVVHDEVNERISRVHGDFRQTDILEDWNSHLSVAGVIQTAQIAVSCGSGTYMRRLASDIGEKLGVPALAYRIERPQVGTFGKDDCIVIQ